MDLLHLMRTESADRQTAEFFVGSFLFNIKSSGAC